MLGAIHRLHGEGLDLGLAFAQVLHLAVVDVVGPGSALGDGQATQRTRARGAVAGQELGLIGAVHVGHAQGAGLGQQRGALIFGHATGVAAGNDGSIINRRDSPGHAASGTVQTICDCVFERNIAIEIRGWRKDQLAVGQSDRTIADRHRAAFGNGLTIDGGDAEAIAI